MKKLKFATKLDYAKYNIDNIKNIINIYNNQIASNQCSHGELNELNNKLKFMQGRLSEEEELYTKYLKHNEPYYELQSYEYYKELFSKVDWNTLYLKFTHEVTYFIDNDIKPSEKVKILKNLVRAFKEREKELFKRD